MKGISPLVATVILVALVIGIAGIVSLFASNLVSSSTGVTSNQSSSLTKCAGSWINVYKVTNSTVFYSNPNNQVLTGLTLIYGDGKQSVTVLDPSLSVGEYNYTSLTSSGDAGIFAGAAAGNTSITVRGLCQTLVSVQGICRQGQDCWQTATV
ncbi:MAG: hypothetical protein HYW22_01210 [Candidatus Aenigmarchaeota archaeon]|nr:hypothetical protein [Candidatus Aenigmarchaeota archaeon]